MITQRQNDFRASGSGCIDYSRQRIDLECIRIAFEVAHKLDAQSIAFDFVSDSKRGQRIVEISYTYVPEAVYDCEGYWDNELQFQPGHVWPQDAILMDILKEVDGK
jgi:hypothetical protein